ncbi:MULTISPECIES: ABC transporter permease [Thermomonospora]|uniref:ABC-2 type transport system permease protein n=1 Tax=Thermomonospora cellulosilytica TaxID=1411118 RepID=A0A7W3R6A0_9ACTN|nr:MULTISPECIES: ABC transporter permease [Thermomonospora]MBA9001259.1 ABC-2 type transport system permease protein [Thermomonospora cellulosilytica]
MTTGAIHDIGYRHYQGRRLGRSYLMRSLYVHNLRGAWGLGRPARAKVMPALFASIMLLPAAGSVAAVALAGEADALIPYSAYPTYLQPVIAIFLATQAPVLASRELRFRVVPLYFSRPVRALDFVLAKLAAMTTALLLLMAVPVTVLYVGGLVNRVPDAGTHLREFLLALVGVVLFAVVLASIGLVVAAFTPRRGFGVAAVIAVFMLSLAFVQIVQGIATAQTRFELAGWMGLLTPFNLVDAVQVRLLGAEQAGGAVPPGVLGGLVALLVCGCVVAGSIAVLYRRFRKGADL